LDRQGKHSLHHPAEGVVGCQSKLLLTLDNQQMGFYFLASLD
jgi:hypothetical protein